MNMPKVDWCYVDVNYLAWRAYHTTGHLSQDGRPTGVIFGVMRELRKLRELFSDPRMAFFFDHPISLRKEKYDWYKNDPKKKLAPEIRAAVAEQVNALASYLVMLGYENQFCVRGYECDDLIAHTSFNVPSHRNVVIVSGDRDLYQCLDWRHWQYHPASGQTVSVDDFRAKFYGIEPQDFDLVKAIAGCASDNIKGVRGVGELTAAKYLADKPVRSVLFDEINSFVEEKGGRYEQNLECTHLPYKDCPPCKLTSRDEPTDDKWDEVCREFGFESLMTPARIGMERKKV